MLVRKLYKCLLKFLHHCVHKFKLRKTSCFTCFFDARDGHRVDRSTVSRRPESLGLQEGHDFSRAYTIIDIVKHALSIPVQKIDNWNHQQKCHHKAGFVLLRCDNRLREAASVDYQSDFGYDFSYKFTIMKRRLKFNINELRSPKHGIELIIQHVSRNCVIYKLIA